MESVDMKVKEWASKVLARLCPHCTKSCCDLRVHNITISQSETLPLIENGVRIYTRDYMSKHGIAFSGNRYRYPSGNEIKTPSLVQITDPTPENEAKYEICSHDFCPMYDKKTKMCRIHSDPRRPFVCRNYPVFTHSDSSYVPIGMIMIKESCGMFCADPIQEALAKEFPKLRVVEESELYAIKQQGEK